MRKASSARDIMVCAPAVHEEENRRKAMWAVESKVPLPSATYISTVSEASFGSFWDETRRLAIVSVYSAIRKERKANDPIKRVDGPAGLAESPH